MPESQVPLIRGDKSGQDSDWGDNLPVNMLAVIKPIHGAPGYMRTHSGLTDFGVTYGADRGAVYNERLGLHFRVSGDQFLTLTSDGRAQPRQTVTGSGQCSLPYSFNTQGVLSDGRFWLFSAGGGVVEVTDPDLGTPIDATWIDGYYVFTDGEYLFHTRLNDETAIDPLEFATAEIQPDKTLGVARDFDNKLMAFGRYTIEYFSNDASDNFAFSRIPGRAKSIGIIGTHAKTQIGGQWLIVGGRKEEKSTVYLFSASQTTRVASRQVEKIFEEYTEAQLQSVVVESRQDKDQEIAIIHLPRHTLVYNSQIGRQFGTDNAWSLIRDDVKTGGDYPGINGVYDPRASKWIYGDKSEGRVGYLNFENTSIYGNQVESICYTPFIDIERASIDEVEVETVPGDAPVDMSMFISISYDGVIFGREYIMPYSKPNNRTLRFQRYRLGYVNNWCSMKFRGVADYPYSIAMAKLTYA